MKKNSKATRSWQDSCVCYGKGVKGSDSKHCTKAGSKDWGGKRWWTSGKKAKQQEGKNHTGLVTRSARKEELSFLVLRRGGSRKEGHSKQGKHNCEGKVPQKQSILSPKRETSSWKYRNTKGGYGRGNSGGRRT